MLTIALILASALSPSAEARTIGGDFDPAPFCFQSPYDPTSPEADQLCCINVFHPDICPDVLEDAFELALDPDGMQSRAVTTNRPSFDGEPMGSIDPDLCHSLAVTHLGESMSTTTGYNRDCEERDDGWLLDVGWMPAEGWTDRLQLYLMDDPTFATYAFGSLPIPQGATELDVALLDSPELDHHDTVGQGDAISWQPVDGVSGYMLYGYDGDGSLAWYLYPDDLETSLTVPRFPADFEPSIIADGGAWAVIARHIVYTDDGELDQAEDYTGSITHGGDLSL